MDVLRRDIVFFLMRGRRLMSYSFRLCVAGSLSVICILPFLY